MLALPLTADRCPFCDRRIRVARSVTTGKTLPLSAEPGPLGVISVYRDVESGELRVKPAPTSRVLLPDEERVESHLSECDRPSAWYGEE